MSITLEAANLPPNWSEWEKLPSWDCPGCGETIHAQRVPEYRGDAISYARAKTCCASCYQKVAAAKVPRRQVLEHCGVPRLYRREFRPELTDQRIRYQAGSDFAWRDWCAAEGQPLLLTLTGSPGVGKGMLATQLLLQAWRAGRLGSRWCSAPEIIDEHFESNGGRALRAQAEQFTVAVLDEVGRARASTEWGAAVLGQIVEYRLARERWTIVVTNLPPEPDGSGVSLREFDAALYDRLAGEGLIWNLTGESLRGAV